MRSTRGFKDRESGGVETAADSARCEGQSVDELAGYAKIEAREDSTGYVRIKLEDNEVWLG